MVGFIVGGVMNLVNLVLAIPIAALLQLLSSVVKYQPMLLLSLSTLVDAMVALLLTQAMLTVGVKTTLVNLVTVYQVGGVTHLTLVLISLLQ
jgi:hypothetical protein